MTKPHDADRAQQRSASTRSASTRSRYVLASLGLTLSTAAVALTYQQRHAVAHRRVESYSTLPVLILQLAGLFTLIAIARLALGHPRHPRTAAALLAAFAVSIAATRALWDTSLPHDPQPNPTTQAPPPTSMANPPRTAP